ncbi:hypothetical protein PBI_KEPLER_55 [Arthrobacter phage Kepler]|uniref:Uncharacterized protein n=2 Tax=Coralvirus TaxID=2733171 RepID=A0A5J6TQM2_9CAUD|nr:hypothetical protein HOU55_gp55 [Arthrobacter phage Kepler]AYN58282.1 hypothetical protein PBI_KEPLER_55 [Arthrobacter phage Kepler]QFG13106.1 hypothetical protein PBI_AMELIA_54 [Arthrobacter phage Amelia]
MSGGPEDYRCQHCQELVLYRTDHADWCRHYPKDVRRWN